MRASGPSTLNACAVNGKTPGPGFHAGIRPGVGLSPHTPLACAGSRTEPP